MCRFYDFCTPCPQPWNCPHASRTEPHAHWLHHCASRRTCSVYIEHATRLSEAVELTNASQAWSEARTEHFSTLRGLPERALDAKATEAQRAERTDRLARVTQRLQITGREFKARRERVATRRFVWEALAGMPQYPAYVVAGMVFREVLAYVPWEFPVFVLWRMWEEKGREKEERWRCEAGPREQR
ncbi:hypothetical protein MMC18_002416 [Xylographa bjoerkii]|nr:hypothetical protein [Xylographa bjoerkii]